MAPPPINKAQRSREFRLHSIFSKTGGRCHFCGAKLRFDNRGFSENPRGHWEVDHIVQRKHGGADTVDNYLPACTTCNRLRWSLTGDDLQLRLFMGILAVRQMNDGTQLGAEFSELLDRRLAHNQERRVPDAEKRRLRRRAGSSRTRRVSS